MTDIVFEDTGYATDLYMDKERAVNRLLEEWDRWGYLIVAYDFDDTVYNYHNLSGNPNRMIIELLKACKEAGCKMIVFTVRREDTYDFVESYLKKNDIPYDYINENIPELSIDTSRKIFYNIFFDDRCGLASAYEIMVETLYRRLRSRR